MRRNFKPTTGALFSSLLILAVLIGLGAWQMQRMESKNRLLGEIGERMKMLPAPMPEQLEPVEWEYRRVTLTGTFLHEHEFMVKPRTLEGRNGYHLLVPFRRLSGGIVMVNRGWLSDETMKLAKRPKGVVQIEGIVTVYRPSAFMPPNNMQKNDWYWPDVKAMAAAAKLQNLSPVIVTIASRTPDVYPVGGKVEVNIRNDHKQYAIFWFTMALISQIIFFLRFWQPVRDKRAGV